MSSVPTLNINVVAAETGLDALRLKIQGISSAVAGMNVNSPLDALRQQVLQDVSAITSSLKSGLASAFAGGAQGVNQGSAEILRAVQASNAQILTALDRQTEDLVSKTKQGAARQVSAEKKKLAELAEVNAKARAEQAALGAAPVNLRMVAGSFKQDEALSEAKFAAGVARAKASQKLAEGQEAQDLKAVTQGDARLKALAKLNKEEELLNGQKARADETLLANLKKINDRKDAQTLESQRIAEKAADANAAKNGAFSRATPASRLATGNKIAGALDFGASDESIIKKHGTAALEAAKNLSALEAATLKTSPAMKGLTLDMNDAHAAARGLAGGFGQLWLTYGNLAPLLAGAAVSAGFVAVIKLGAEVQNTFAAIGALSEESSASVLGLNTQMLEMARSGPFGPREVAEAMKTLSLAGLEAKEVSRSIGDVLRFAVAGDTSIKTSAETLTTVAVAFRLGADSYGYIGDVIAKTAAASKASVESISSAFKSASVINTNYGASLEDVGVGLALLQNAGVQNSAAGTSLRNFYADLTGKTPKARAELDTLAKSIGVSSIAMDAATGKAKPLVEIIGNLDKALANFTPTAQAKALQNIFSERGEKSGIGFLTAYTQELKTADGVTTTVFANLKQKIDEAAGFAVVAAAKMSLTPLNQMRAVAATLQATFVETFSEIQPQVVAVAETLKNAFASQGFKDGVVTLATAVASLTVSLAKNLDVILLWGSAFLGAKVALAAGGGLATLLEIVAVRTAAASTAMGGYALAATAASRSNVIAAESTLALSGAQATAAGAAGAYAASKAAVVSRTSAFLAVAAPALALVSKIALPLTLAYTAWEFYSFWTGKSTEKNQESLDPRLQLLASLEKEAKRLQDVNTARALGISLEELQRQDAGKKAKEEAQPKYDKARAAYAAVAAEAEARSDAHPSVRARIEERRVVAAKEMNKIALENLDIEQKIAAATSSVSAAARIEAARLKAEVKNNAVPKNQGALGADVGEEEGRKRAANYGRMLSAANEYYRDHKKTLDDAFSQELTDIKAQVRAREITEGAGYARSLVASASYETQQRELINTTYEERVKGLTKLYADLPSKGKEREGALEVWIQELKKAESQFDETTKQLDQLSTARKKQAGYDLTNKISDENKALQDLSASVTVYLEQLRLKAVADTVSAGATESQRAGMEASANFMAKFTDDIAKHAKAADVAAESVLDLQIEMALLALQSDLTGQALPDVYKELQGKLEKTLKGMAEARALLEQAKGTVTAGAAVAGQEASSKKLVEEYDKANKEIKDKLSSAIFDAATTGGKGMKDQLKKAVLDFSKEKFKMVMDVILNPVSKALTAFLSPEAAQAAGATGGGMGDMLSTGKGVFDAISSGFTKLGSAVSSQFSSFATSSVGQSMGLSTSSLSGLGGAEVMTTSMTSAASSMATAAGSLASAGAGIAAGLGLRSAISGDMSMGRGMDNFQKVGVAVAGALGGPIMGAIAGAGMGLLNRAFGMGSKNNTAEGLSGKFGASTGAEVQTYSSWQQKGGWFRSDKSGTDYAPVQAALDKFLDLSIVAITSKAKAYAAAVGASSEAVTNYTEDINVSLKGLTTEEQNKALEKAMQTFSDNMALQVVGLSNYVREGESASAVLANMANSLSAVNSAFGLVNLTLFDSTLVGAEAASKLLTAFGGVEKFSSGLNSYYENYFTAEEKRANTIKAITKTLNAAGGNFTEAEVGGASKKDFRAVFEKAGNTPEFLAAMISVAPAFSDINQEIDSLATTITKLKNPIRTVSEIAQSLVNLDREGANLQADLMEAKGNTQGAKTARTNLETSGYTEAEKAVYLYNLGLKEQIKVANEATSLQDRLNTATDTAAQAATRARDAILPFNLALYDSVIAAEKAKEVAAEAKGLQDQLNAARDTEAEAVERQRKALDSSNQGLFDQLQAQLKLNKAKEEEKGLLERLYGATDSAAQAAERARKAIDPLNRALYDTVVAAEASKVAMESFKENIASTVAKFSTPEQNRAAKYTSIAEELKTKGFASGDVLELVKKLQAASKSEIWSSAKQVFDGLGAGAVVAREELRKLVDKLGDIKTEEASEALEKATAVTEANLAKLAASLARFGSALNLRVDLAGTSSVFGSVKTIQDGYAKAVGGLQGLRPFADRYAQDLATLGLTTARILQSFFSSVNGGSLASEAKELEKTLMASGEGIGKALSIVGVSKYFTDFGAGLTTLVDGLTASLATGTSKLQKGDIDRLASLGITPENLGIGPKGLTGAGTIGIAKDVGSAATLIGKTLSESLLASVSESIKGNAAFTKLLGPDLANLSAIISGVAKDDVQGLNDAFILLTGKFAEGKLNSEQYKTAIGLVTDAFKLGAVAAESILDAYNRLRNVIKTNEQIAQERIGLEDRLYAATDTAAQALTRARNAIDPYNRALFDTVIAAEKAKEAASKLLPEAFSAVQRAVEAQKKITQAARDAAAEAVTEITSVFDVLKSSVKELYGSVDSTAKMQTAQGRAFITQALATAKATGYLPESKALTEAINAAKGGTEEFASQFEKDFATLTLAGDLSELERFAKTQLTAAEQALKYQEDQLKKLDEALTLAQQQLDAANGVNTSVLSLKDALAAFAAALSAQTDVTTKVVTAGSDTKTTPVTIASLIAGINTTNPGYSNFIGKASDYSGVTVEQFKALVKGAGIPGFATGINRVPQDMLARIHKDEAVIPSAFNPFNPNAKTNTSGGSDRLEVLVATLIEKVQRLEVVGTEGNVQQRRTAEILNDVTEGGANMRTLAT